MPRGDIPQPVGVVVKSSRCLTSLLRRYVRSMYIMWNKETSRHMNKKIPTCTGMSSLHLRSIYDLMNNLYMYCTSS